MPEHASAQAEQPSEILSGALDALHRLYRKSSTIPDEKLVAERERRQLPKETRKLFDFYVRVRERGFRRRFRHLLQGPQAQETQDGIDRTMLMLELRRLQSLLEENYRDWTLSTESHPIYAKQLALSRFKTTVRSMMREQPQPDDLRRIGFAFFDGNAVKAMSDCTSYDNVTAYLQTVATIFTNADGPTNKRLAAEKFETTALSIGGDEIAVFLCAPHPITDGAMEQIVRSYQREITADPRLSGFLNLDNPQVLTRFACPTEEALEEFRMLGAEEQEKALREVRATLPPTFTATFAGGGATLDEAIIELIRNGEMSPRLEGETFDSAREKMFEKLKSMAERRQNADKQAYKRELLRTDPLSHNLMLRNGENRRLRQRLSEAQKTIIRLEAIISHNRELSVAVVQHV